MRSKSYIIPINPIAWKRAGLSHTRFYDSQARDKVATGLYLSQQHGNDPLFINKPLAISIIFYIKPPKLKKPKLSKWHFKAPDCDNFQKFLFDAMKDIIIQDDKLFAHIDAKKIYSDNPRTEFTITELE